MSTEKPKTIVHHTNSEPQTGGNQSIFQRTQSIIDKKRSPLPPPRTKIKHITGSNSQHSNHHGSDSEASNAESNSLSGESGTEHLRELVPLREAGVGRKKGNRRRGSEWEIIEGLKDGQRFDTKPERYAGYLHKKRKWPLKGWHKRYFVLEKGLLVYAKSPNDITRGRLHGSVDIGLSVISTKEKRKRLDIDAEEFIYHLKAKTIETFECWVQRLKAHRLYRQHVLTYGSKELPLIRAPIAVLEEIDSPGLPRNKIPLTPPEVISRDGSLTRGMKPITSGNAITTGGRLAAWLIDSGPNLDSINKELNHIQENLNQLGKLIDNIDTIQVALNSTGESEVCSFTGLNSSPQAISNQLSTSNTSLSGGGVANSNSSNNLPIAPSVARPHSLPNSDCLQNNTGGVAGDRHCLSCAPEYQVKEDYGKVAKDVYRSLKNVLFSLTTERNRLKSAIEAESSSTTVNPNAASLNSVVASLRSSLNQALQQNQEMRNRIAKIHENSDLSDLSSIGPASEVCRQLNQSLSYSSSCVSGSEFYDAEDVISNVVTPPDGPSRPSDDEIGDTLDLEPEVVVPCDGSDTSSEAGSITSEEGSVSSENSEIGTEYNAAHSLNERGESTVQCMTGRRTRLPVPRPDTEGLSLWNLLCKNIGKDLSQISMPVALNEPLNMLQRLCEELEYSELLDKAAELDDPLERMVYVAAFAVSSYGSSYFRAGNKPFNPLLGETYECIREDKGFRFISEQVSHHPPVSVCHAESRNFIFWQNARIKTKFWGKSMEFQPLGMVNLQLPKTGDHYQWNKVTTCVHNLFSGQRWVDQYGELKITNLTTGIVCKLTFVKASYWSAKRHEIYGVITTPDGKVARKLFGKWSEALYCGVAPSAKCIWRQGTMPEDYELYYGFTRFAIELNELGPEVSQLPITDTRLRPDQRALERGDLDAAERLKLQLEQNQRERRKKYELENINFEPLWFNKKMTPDGEEQWEYNGKYWEKRKNPGFVNMKLESLW
ncbi:oxysterol-binding protein-related protein 6-like isoform X3 [Chrysoperla carnea]|uniref:oxysterol-binding protein-related protein 6-like isoform X3 n=1 Tax=Chrysoperla carnea TaxID=189513 RepID=UPI001D0771D2|nr:oxysterol-binding protein-related protein 6-like isoform X3 [Chrysoperla carnea]